MFGSLRPSLCALQPDDRQSYRRAYCGTCKALGDGYGQLARPLLSYDVVFLAALIEGSQEQASPTSTCRCPMLPVLQKPVIDPASPAVRVSAAVQVILASAWFDDQVADGSAAFYPARALARPKAAKAHADLAALGIDLGVANNLSAKQAELESCSKDIRELAAPTSQVLASLLAQVPNLPGAQPLDQSARDAMSQLGESLGVAVYALDALEDAEDDVQRARFNPCIGADNKVCAVALATASTELARALARIDQALEVIPFARGEAGIRAAAAGLVRRCHRAIALAESKQAEWAEIRRRYAPERWLRTIASALLWIPSWFLRAGKRVAGGVRSLRREPINARECTTHHAYALQIGPDYGSGLGPGVSSDPPGQAPKPKRPKKEESSCWSAFCCVDCCCTGCEGGCCVEGCCAEGCGAVSCCDC